MLLVVLTIFVFCVAVIGLQLGCTLNPIEFSALQDLYNSTDGPNWNWRNATNSGPVWFGIEADPCFPFPWQGLTCGYSSISVCYIKQIELDDYRLNGPLPDSIGNFKNLTVLDLGLNYLPSSLPLSIGNLTMIEHLLIPSSHLVGQVEVDFNNLVRMLTIDLERNNLTGSIPESLYSCEKLNEIRIGFQNITGTISNSIKNLVDLKFFNAPFTNLSGTLPQFPSNLSELTLTHARFSGTIPSDLLTLKNLTHLYLTANRLVGCIPDSFAIHSRLIDLALDSNLLIGSIPVSFKNAVHLIGLYLEYNKLNGSIENLFEDKKALFNVQIFNNFFSGSLPNLTKADNVAFLDVSSNSLNGSLPVSSCKARKLVNFLFDYNSITGSLPDCIGNWQGITQLSGQYNSLTGSIPATICQIPVFRILDLTGNYLSKTIPVCLFSLAPLNTIYASDNQLTGTLPLNGYPEVLEKLVVDSNQLTGPLPNSTSHLMKLFQLEHNDFTGTIPKSLFDGGLLYAPYKVFEVSHNYLHGTIPPEVSLKWTLNMLNFYQNFLSGTVPYIGDLRVLAIFYIDTNFLTGSLACFNSTNQKYLSTLDISLNEFTGKLPDEMFLLPSLESLSLVQNCLTGHIPESICNATKLLVLALDGLHTAPSCRFNLINGNYALKYHTPGTIPSCLFSLPRIQIIHLSGNGLGGSLPFDLNVSSTLEDISLSYNQLSGQLPYLFQMLPIRYFDLSYNLLNGLLIQNIAQTPFNGTVYLQVNRLSGRIPPSLVLVDSVSILNSNLFECESNRKQLPKYDNDTAFYDCGTTSLQTAMFVFVGFFVVACCIPIALYFTGNDFFVALKLAILNGFTYIKVLPSVGKEFSNIQELNKFLSNIRYGFCVLTIVIVLLLMPIYVALSESYSIFASSYAWVVSSVYLGGFVPAIVLMVCFILFDILMYSVIYHMVRGFYEVDVHFRSSVDTINTVRKNYKHFVGLILIAVFNAIVVLGVNVSYVLASTRLTPHNFVVIQILLAQFKFIWNDVVIRDLTNRLHRYSIKNNAISMSDERTWNSRYLVFNVNLLMFNTIIIPCVATAVVSSECLFNVYFKPLEVTSTLSYASCASYETNDPGVYSPQCTEETYDSFETSFLPPYSYRYQCAATLVTTYAVVYVYKFIWTSFARPAIALYLIRLDETLPGDSWLLKYIEPLVPKLKHMKPLGQSIKSYFFSSNQFCLRMVMYLSILSTYGVMFPPLAMMICISAVIQTYFTQLILGRFISKQDDTIKKTMLAYLNQDAANTGVMFMKSVYVVGGPAAFFYAFFLFDTYGDVAGGKKALQLAIPLFVFCILCAVFFRLKATYDLSSNPSMPDVKEIPRSVELRTRSVSKPAVCDDESCIASSEMIVSSPVHEGTP